MKTNIQICKTHIINLPIMKNVLKQCLTAVVAVIFLFASCSKESPITPDESINGMPQVTKVIAVAHNSIAKFLQFIFIARTIPGQTIENQVGCGRFRVDIISPARRVYTADFGKGCSFNGIKYEGIVTANLIGIEPEESGILTFQFPSLKINGDRISGTLKIQASSWPTLSGDKGYKIESQLKSLSPKNAAIWFKCDWDVEHRDAGTPTFKDDKVRFSGHTRVSNGRDYKVQIWNTPLRKTLFTFGCDYITEGRWEVYPGMKGITPFVLNFGYGSCDTKATVRFRNDDDYTYGPEQDVDFGY